MPKEDNWDEEIEEDNWKDTELEDEDYERDNDEYQEELEEIIEETPVASYPQSFESQRVSPWIEAEEIQSNPVLERQLGNVPIGNGNQATAENEPVYSTDTYQNTEQQTESLYPRQIQMEPMGFSPSMPQHILNPQFDTVPRTIQTRTMPDELEQLKMQNKEYQSEFEQRAKHRRRF